MICDYDVVVVGSGACGLTGAVRAASHGLRVLVLEKADVCGGTAALTGGGLWAPANKHLLAAGVADDLDQAQTYLDHTVGDRTPLSMQQAFLHAAADTIDWLDTLGVRFSWMGGFPDYHPHEPGGHLRGRAINPQPVSAERAAELQHGLQPTLTKGDGGPALRAHDTKGRLWGGQSLIAQLLLAGLDLGVDVWTSAPFLDLVQAGSKIVGVVASRDGQQIEIAAPAGVLLAAGGFEHNPVFRTQHQGDFVGHGTWSLGVAGNTGDAIEAGMRAGAATDLLEDAWWTPAVQRPDGGSSFLLWERTAPVGFIVDQSGRRWINEGLPYNTFGHAMQTAGPDAMPSWQVFDQHALTTYGYAGLGDDLDAWLAAGTLLEAATIAELAKALEAPHLAATVERWNDLATKGVDEDFGRGAPGTYEAQILSVFQSYPGVVGAHDWPNPSLAPLGEGPYYAARVVLGDLGTKGGLVCDEHGRVTRPGGEPIPGLYACGNTMASVMGHAYPGPGSCITPGMAFGRLAADDMAGRQFT